jgi:hypothetical protein
MAMRRRLVLDTVERRAPDFTGAWKDRIGYW